MFIYRITKHTVDAMFVEVGTIHSKEPLDKFDIAQAFGLGDTWHGSSDDTVDEHDWNVYLFPLGSVDEPVSQTEQ